MSIIAHTEDSQRAFGNLRNSIYDAPVVKRILSDLGKGNGPVEFVRAAGSLPCFIASAVVERMQRRVLYIAPDMRTAEMARDDLRTLLGEENAWLLPPRGAIPYDPLHQNNRFDERAGVFENLVSGKWNAIIAVPSVLVERFESLKVQSDRLIRFQVNDEIDREALVLILTESGMRREIRVEGPGQFTVRGSVVDIFPPSFEEPVRLELWGDEITEMRNFDPVTQRSSDHVSELMFYAGEQKEAPREAGIWDLLPHDAVVFIDDADSLELGLNKAWEEIQYQYIKRRDLEKDRKTPEPETLYHLASSVYTGFSKYGQLIHRGEAAPTKGAYSLESRSHESYMGDLERLIKHFRQYRVEGMQSVVLCERESQVDRLEDMLVDRGCDMNGIHVTIGAIHNGFTWPEAEVSVFTDHQIFGRYRRTSPFRKRKRRIDPTAFEELQRGDFVVHAEFGVGRYLGLKKIKVNHVERECLQIEYKDDVKVYVRLDQFASLQKYQGADGVKPKLSKIGGTDWSTARNKTLKAVEKLAREILELYARRQIEGGHAFAPDTPWQREMEAAFEFEDTPDQATAAEEIKQDMEKNLAMDRLLCGDVGFGKTEVAVRAAFKAMQDSKQVAVLVPTTILAQQHYSTFLERLRRYPVQIEVLSRFRTAAQQKRVVQGLKDGKVDLLIGTHRLLSRDIEFNNLGLLIVDEEHRFGVKHKEKLRQLRASVDVLTMSATPIPRTLHMALSGAKDMSMISTPPVDRHPIQTEIAPFDERLIREAIVREMARGGQVYLLHNRVKSIHAIQTMVQRLVPGVRTAVAHGQMKERELENVMQRFLENKHDVLICTMIIESGLDIPNVNTLIVNRADRLGLAQLYQVRGRIGRSHRKAFAYMLTPPRMLLNIDARKRLETIAENTRLGSGFQIAMRDLEIRGAGNLLGPQQSGFINAVGFEMYTEMLADAVRKLSDESDTKLPEVQVQRSPRDVKVDVALDAMLPPAYVTEASERVELYRRLSRAGNVAEVLNLREELVDRFGKLPEEAANLLWIVETQARAVGKGVARVDLAEDALFVEFVSEYGGDDFGGMIGVIMDRLQEFPVELKGSGSFGLKVELLDCEDWTSRWKRLMDVLKALPEFTL